LCLDGSGILKVFLKVASVIIVVLIVFVVVVIANKGGSKTAEDYLTSKSTPSETASAVPSASPSVSPSPSNGPVDPLTGLPVDSQIGNMRPYAIMINNISTAQPQIGISKADLIYEILVEGGITRMMAVFQDVSNAGEIGSIRSARPYFVDIALGLDALYIHAGGSPDAYEELASTGIFHLDGVNGGKTDIFFRDPDRVKKMGSVHSLVTTADLILKYLPTYKVDLEHKTGYTVNMSFSDNAAPDGGQTAESITAHFSSSKSTTFNYSDADGVYNISQFGKAYTDGNNSAQISVKNVVVLRTTVNVISGDEKGRIDVGVTGTGKGTFFSGGKYEDIKWSRGRNTDQFTFTREDGTAVTFGKGKTYFCIIANSGKLDIK
jgi:hypothetical protein